jgi:hypothetical protein
MNFHHQEDDTGGLLRGLGSLAMLVLLVLILTTLSHCFS